MSEETEIKMFPMNHPISNPTTQIMRVDLDGGFTVNESIPATDAAKMVLGLMKQEWLADAQCAKIRELQSDVTQLENRLRALWDKLEGERKYYMEHLQLNEELVSEIELENERLKERNKRQNEAIDSLREMYAKEAKP